MNDGNMDYRSSNLFKEKSVLRNANNRRLKRRVENLMKEMREK
jgi:hypothetical protein